MADDAPPIQSTEQPTEQATETADVVSDLTTDEQTTTQPSQSAAPPASPSLFQGRYQSPEEGFWHLKGQLDALQTRPAAQAQEVKPQFTTDQLWTLRAQKLTEMAAAQAGGEAEKALQAAANINWIDNQIHEQRFGSIRKELSAQSSLNALASEGADLLKPFQADMTPGNPVYETALNYYSQIKSAIEAGVPIPDNILSGLATAAAILKTGKATAGIEQQARAQFAGALQQSLKQAIVTGAGSVGKTTEKAPDFSNMTDQEFRDYERKIGTRHD